MVAKTPSAKTTLWARPRSLVAGLLFLLFFSASMLYFGWVSVRLLLLLCIEVIPHTKGKASMVKQQVMKLVAGLALILVLLGGLAFSTAISASHAASAAHASTAHHVLADVDPPPPGH
jgi:TRAP-type mannitol/chloroaromatic compound transport system permease large subunit